MTCMMNPVPRDLGVSQGAPVPPAATRVARPGWRDPRLWIGVLLVTGSVVVGARLLAAADDSVTVWALADARGSGTPVSPDDLVAARVRFADDEALDRYFLADEDVPAELVLTREVGEGELLARSAVGSAEDNPVLQVPLEVDPNRVPPDVDTGSVVDVWVTDAAAAAQAVPSRAGRGDTKKDAKGTQDGEPQPADPGGPALSEVTVVAAPTYDDTFAVTGARQLVIAVEDEQAAAFEHLLASLQEPVIRILQRS